MADFRRKLGVDYLSPDRSLADDRSRSRGAGGLRGGTSEPRGLSFQIGVTDEAVLGVGHRLLRSLAEQNSSGQLWDLIDQLGMPIEEALAVTQYLDEHGYLRIVSRDLKGNHSLEITDAGRSVVV